MRICKNCKQSNPLPEKLHSNKFWTWESKKDRKSGGLHYCRSCRTTKKRAAWDNFYKNNHLRCVVSRAITQKLKRHGANKSGSIVDSLPYSINELKIHLESKFLPGMTWDNYGQWHIDHVVPDSSFNYDKMSDNGFLQAWDISNLQPLWATDNHKKYNKFIR